jgi:hypothetical protein
VATVGVERWPDVVRIEAMGGPRATGFGFVVDNDMGTRGSKGRSIEIKGAMHLGVG